MDPADSRTVSQEELLAQLWNYCRSIIQVADPHQRHIQVVFFDTFLSSTTFSVSFLDIKRLISIITILRASSSFELLGLGCPGKEDVATSLGALAAFFFFHRQTASPPSLAAHLLDPPLRGKRFPRSLHLTTSPLTPAACAESADEGPAVQNNTAAVLPGRLVEPQSDTPAPASFGKRCSRRRHASPPPDSLAFPQPIVVSHMDNSSSLASSVYSLDCVNANLVAQPVALAQSAAQHVTQSAAQHVTQSLVQSASHPRPQLEVDMPAGPTLPSFHQSVVPASLSSLPRVAATPSSPPPSAATSPPASHQTAATAALLATPSTPPARPSSSPPAATASPSSPPDQPSIAALQPEEQLSERGSPRHSRRRSSASGGARVANC
ncbi:proline-rich protein 36-like [Oreochromis niloticus]|uniref:proline-rich protein 36-like n=1 Tax=Oreochromis niloticus TaxID=8128 RepID=UPI000904F042|nr:proline-rich protein 36-like [Oreochromis niloticus]